MMTGNCCGESDGGVFPLEWRYRGVMRLEDVSIYYVTV